LLLDIVYHSVVIQMYQGLMDLFQMTRYKIFKDVLEVERQNETTSTSNVVVYWIGLQQDR